MCVDILQHGPYFRNWNNFNAINLFKEKKNANKKIKSIIIQDSTIVPL